MDNTLRKNSLEFVGKSEKIIHELLEAIEDAEKELSEKDVTIDKLTTELADAKQELAELWDDLNQKGIENDLNT